jgi:hypothetical protein
MNRDVQYIGMDAHKEAVVIAVLNGSGKLVMESKPKSAAFCSLPTVCGGSRI